MAFDAGHRSYEPEPQRLPREPKTLGDHADFVLRAIVIAPLIGLYSWWMYTLLRDVVIALIARFTA